MTELDTRHRSSVYDSMVKITKPCHASATGMTDKDFEHRLWGVISTWAENTPCKIHLHDFGNSQRRCQNLGGALACLA